MEGLLLLIMVLQEKSWKDIINHFKYIAGYYILYPAIVQNNIIPLNDFNMPYIKKAY